MYTRRDFAAATAASSVVALALGACTGDAGKPGAGGPIELTVSTWTANEPGLADWWPELVEEFEARNQGVTVDVRQVAYADYVTQITTQLIAGSGPEVIHVPTPTSTLPAWADAGLLSEADSYLAQTDVLDQWPDTQDVMSWNGTNYGALLVDYGYVLFYNEELLEQAGVGVPSTPEELLEAAEAVTSMGGDALGFAVTDDNSANFIRDALVFVAGTGAPWIRDGAWNLTDPQVVQAFEYWRVLGSEYSPKGTDVGQKREAFLAGNVAMMIEGPFYYATIQSSAEPDMLEALKVTAPPFEHQPTDVSHGLVIPADIDVEVAEVAQDFIELAVSEQMMERYAQLVSSPVARPGAAESLRDDEATVPIADASEAENSTPLVDPELQGLRSAYTTFSELAAEHLSQLLRGGASTSSVLEEFEKALIAEGVTP